MANEPHFEVYTRSHSYEPDEFGWRFRAANGQITAISGEGFTREEDAERAITDFVETALTISTGHPQWPMPAILRVAD